tara:strand:+ start:1570 stop:7344 length:5775 start_codon:yes stop_codon:yes gene_type:complete
MSQVGRISGSLLTANLERNGKDLSFKNTSSDTRLLYLDVSTNKIAVNKDVAGYDLEIAGTVRSTNLITPTSSIANYTISDNNLSVLVGDIYLNAAEAVVFGNIENGTLRISDNTISATVSNANIDLMPSTDIADIGALVHTLDNPNAYGTSVADQFGRQSAISGNYAIVGAYGEGDAGGITSGKAYIFNVTSGALVHTLDNPNAYGTSADDRFGGSVAISGNYAIVGAYFEDEAGRFDPGKAYIFNVSTGALVHTLDNPTAYSTSSYDRFGYSVAISGDIAIVGAYFEDDAGGYSSGKAYIFNVTSGALVHTLDNPNAYGTSQTDYFGQAVAISGNSAIVGAYGEGDAGGVFSGKAYIFNVTTGALVHTLDNPNAYSDTVTYESFGYSVAISGNYAIVGAFNEDEAGFFGGSSGKAYIFNVTSGALVHTLDNPNAYGTIQGDIFGYSVAISGNSAIVGAYYEDDAGGTFSGKAYIFNVTSGALVHTLDNPNAYGTSQSDQFSYSVAISGNSAIVGANGEDDAGGGASGKAYIYKVANNTTETNSINVFGNIHTPGNITFDGTITLGNQYLDTVDFNASVTSSVVPDQTDTYNLGTNTKRWNNLYTNLVNGTSVNVSELIVGFVDSDLRVGGKLYVSENGDDTNVGDHIFAPFATLARALQAADASGEQPFVIHLSPGTYTEALPLVVPNNISIVGENIRNCIIVPDASSQSKDVFHLGNNSTVSKLTIKNFYYNSGTNTGYAFRFAPNAIISERSPYIQDVTVLTQPTTPGGTDAGRGAWIDGNELNSASTLSTMLFHSCTFISPGADVINMTNGVRVEWLNSFTYFANRGLHAFNGSNGKVSPDGSTVNYGAELRSIGSANVYGTYGAVADGADTLMYLVQHNFAYIGAGASTDNNEADVIQANETVELNNGKIHYVSTDQQGNFRIGDNFFVDLQTGDTSINIDTGSIEALSGLIINSGETATTLNGNIVTTGNIEIVNNGIRSLSGDLNFVGGTNVINLKDDTAISQNLFVRDNFSFGGALNISGDQEADSLDFNVNFEQNFNPHRTLVHNLGKLDKFWSNVYLGKMQAGDITSNENYITSDSSNADLELRANGTGVVNILESLDIDNDLTVGKISTFKNSTIAYEYGSDLVANGTFDSNIASWSLTGGGSVAAVAGNLRITATGAAQNVAQELTVEIGKTYNFSAAFKNVSNSNAFYLRVFESGVGTLFEWDQSTGLTNNQVVTAAVVPTTTAIDIIFRAVDTVVEWDNISFIEDIGLVETITPVQVNVTGNTTQTSNTVQTGNISQTGNTELTGNLTVNSDFNIANFNVNDNVLQNIREDLRLNPSDPYGALSIPQIVSAMIGGATVDDYAGATEKTLIAYLANGTSAPYANSYIDVNSSGTLTSADSLAWLQYVANGTTNNTIYDAFLAPIVNALLEDEYATPGKYNSQIFAGDYYRADLRLQAAGTGRVSMPSNDVRVSNDLSAASIIANDIIVTADAGLNDIITTTNNIQIDDNFISTSTLNTNLELRATQNITMTTSDVVMDQNLTVNRNTDIDNLNVVGTITQTGNRNQTGNLNVIGNVTVSTSNIKSEIQFDDILFNDNVVETTNSNANLELRANGTGILTIPSNDVTIINDVSLGTLSSKDINVTLALAAEEFLLSSDIKFYDNIITTTTSNSNLDLRSFNAEVLLQDLRVNNDTIQTTALDINLAPAQNLIINATGAIVVPLGTTTERQIVTSGLRFNSTDNLFEAYSNSNIVSFGGVYSSDRRSSVLAHPTNDTINFKIAAATVGGLTADGISIHGLDVDDILFNGTTINTNVSNSDLDLAANGSGKLNLYSTNFYDNKVQNTNAGALSIAQTGYGRTVFNVNSAVAIPFGTVANRKPGATEVGMTRWNTENTILETWDGNTYISAAGSAATISTEEMEELMLEYTLIFG